MQHRVTLADLHLNLAGAVGDRIDTPRLAVDHGIGASVGEVRPQRLARCTRRMQRVAVSTDHPSSEEYLARPPEGTRPGLGRPGAGPLVHPHLIARHVAL